MKNQRNEQIKAGGEVARAMYQRFLKEPRWRHCMDSDEKRLAVEYLNEATTQATKELEFYTAEYGRLLRKGGDDHHEAREEACKRAYRITMLTQMAGIIRHMDGPDLLLQAREN